LPCFHLLMGPNEELELAKAELSALAGHISGDRVATGPIAPDVTRSAYVRLSADLLASGRNWAQLGAAIARLDLRCEDYRIEVFRPAPKVIANALRLQKSIADLISGRPNLDNPRIEFALVVTQEIWHFGVIVSRSAQYWRSQANRPHHCSHGLASRMARALVNLVAAPGDTLLDPCCGSGTVVAEALHDGIHAWGVEMNPSLARQAMANLRCLKLPANVMVGDARCIRGNFDAAVIDFPYGHSTPVESSLYADILNKLRTQVDRVALVCGCDQSHLLHQLGLTIRQQALVTKGQLTRHIYSVSTKRGQQR